MSGIYIPNMETPSCCGECRFLDEFGDYPRCIITDEQRGYNFRIRELRMPHCPLIPAADVRPVEKAEWDDETVAFYLMCSKCGCCVRAFAGEVFLDYAQGWNYCPNCGARMDGEAK